MGKDGLIVGEISNCFPDSNELEVLAIENNIEPILFETVISHIKEFVLIKATKKLYPDCGEGKIH